MVQATIAHTTAAHLPMDLPSDGNGCLVKIYPSDGPSGLWSLVGNDVEIGRSANCDIQLDEESVSRAHARLEANEEGHFLFDLGSTNGTFVNEKRIDQTALGAGDRIRIGNHILKYLSSDSIELQYHETIYRMTTTDGLTSAYNKQYLLECLDRELKRTQRHHHPLSLLMMDIDFFKKVNDACGHLAGDDVLREFSQRVRDSLHDGDIFGRYGGEEFAVLLSDADADLARAIGESIRLAIQGAPFVTHVESIPITTSIGVATTDGQTPLSNDDFIGAADMKLYEAKESGRNRVRG